MNWLAAPAGLEAQTLSEVGWVLIIGAAVIFAITMGLLVMALRRRKRDVPTAWWVLGGGIVFPVAVLGVLLAYATHRTTGLDRPPPEGSLVVSVTGRPWWWEVQVRDPATGRWIALANELHLPLGRPVQIGLASEDVIHSFWVPALGGKMDLVPGRVNRLVVTPTRAGVFRGPCAEYCGTQHAHMTLHVVVEPPAEFERWLARQATPAAPAGPSLQAGQRAFAEHGCAACHTVRGVAGGGLGPDLTHVGSRLSLGAGALPNDRAALRRWIAGVQQHKPGARMASYGHLDPATLDALADYLASLE